MNAGLPGSANDTLKWTVPGRLTSLKWRETPALEALALGETGEGDHTRWSCMTHLDFVRKLRRRPNFALFWHGVDRRATSGARWRVLLNHNEHFSRDDAHNDAPGVQMKGGENSENLASWESGAGRGRGLSLSRSLGLARCFGHGV